MEEHSLIEQTLAGNSDAFGQLLERYQPGLVYHCFAMVHDYDLANDMAQEASIKAYLQLHRYQSQYRFSTWLYKIATNCCLDRLKRTSHLSLDDVAEPPSNYPEAAEHIIAAETVTSLQAAISQLPLKYQTVISLYYWHDRSYDEIAVIMNTPVNTIRTWLHRAKNRLKEDIHE